MQRAEEEVPEMEQGLESAPNQESEDTNIDVKTAAQFSKELATGQTKNGKPAQDLQRKAKQYMDYVERQQQLGKKTCESKHNKVAKIKAKALLEGVKEDTEAIKQDTEKILKAQEDLPDKIVTNLERKLQEHYGKPPDQIDICGRLSSSSVLVKVLNAMIRDLGVKVQGGKTDKAAYIAKHMAKEDILAELERNTSGEPEPKRPRISVLARPENRQNQEQPAGDEDPFAELHDGVEHLVFDKAAETKPPSYSDWARPETIRKRQQQAQSIEACPELADGFEDIEFPTETEAPAAEKKEKEDKAAENKKEKEAKAAEKKKEKEDKAA